MPKIRQQGSAGKFSEDTTKFVDYFKINLTDDSKTEYLVYKYHHKNDAGFSNSSHFWGKFETVTQQAIALEIPTDAKQHTIDTLIYNTFSKYGDIQIIDGDQRYNLRSSGSYPDARILREKTENNPLNEIHLKPETSVGSSCAIV